MLRLAVVGGGVAGLAGARAARLAASSSGLPLRVTLLEAGPRLGGKVRTETVGGLPLEWGPDSLLAAKPWGRELAEALGLGPDLVAPGPAAARTYLWLRGRLRPLPAGLAMGVPTGLRALVGAVREGIVGPLGALRAAAEPLLPAGPGGDPTVAEVARRRLGRQGAARLVAPLVAGVLGVPAEEVSMAAALPHLAGTRSLLAAVARGPRPAGPAFLSIRGGMGRLVERLVEALGGEDLRPGCPAEVVSPDGPRFRIATPAAEIRADAVLLATPATAAARLLAAAAPEASDALGGVRYSPAAVCHLRYEPGDLGQPLDASGYLVAPEEGAVAAACTWIGAKWPHLGADGPRLRSVVTAPEATALPDGPLTDRVVEEVGRIMRARRPPAEVRLLRWGEALPVYAPGHTDRVARALRGLPPRVALAGAAYGGVGVPDCVRSGEDAGRRLVASLSS